MSQRATSIAESDALAAPSLPALCNQSFIRIQSATASRGSAPSIAPNRRVDAAAVAERDPGDVLVGLEVEDRARQHLDTARQVGIADQAIHLHQVLLDAVARDLHVSLPPRVAARFSASRSTVRPLPGASPAIAHPASIRTSLVNTGQRAARIDDFHAHEVRHHAREMRVDVARRLGKRDGKLEAVRGIRELERSRDTDGADVELDDVRGAVMKMRQELAARGEIAPDADRAADRVRDLLQAGKSPLRVAPSTHATSNSRSIVAQPADGLLPASSAVPRPRSASAPSFPGGAPCASPRGARDRGPRRRRSRSFAPRRP